MVDVDTVLVTGHSLGGALATLAVPDILKNTPFCADQVALYTFASPRCGDKEFAEKFQEIRVKHWRICNTEDVVTTLPFPTGNITPIKDQNPDTLSTQDLEQEYQEEAKKGNLFFDFLKRYLDKNKRRMPDYAHTGVPIYFTIHEASLEQHHNLDEVYMIGIGEDPI